MNSLQKAGKSKSSRSKKGGNILGTVGDLVAPTGWGSFATAAALVGIDQVDSALRRKKSEKSSAKKGGMRGGDPMEEARLIQQNNSNLIYAFLRLCGYAFTLENKDEMYQKLKTLLEKEIKYRKKIRSLIQNQETITFLDESLVVLEYLYNFANKMHIYSKHKLINNDKREIFRNYEKLSKYRHDYLENHPNIKNNDLSPYNKTLSNLEEKYLNNKYKN
jgi:hypothetical protein